MVTTDERLAGAPQGRGRPLARGLTRGAATALCAGLVGLMGASGGAGIAPPFAAAATNEDQAPGTARIWSTTPDGTNRLAPVGTVASGAGVAGPRVVLDPTVRGQSVAGFGASLTHSSAALLATLPAPDRHGLLTELFDPSGTVRLSVLRIPLGGSDFVVEEPYTYDDLPPGETDWDLTHFSTAADEDVLRPVLREIRLINPDLLIVGSPWSAPAWLKDSGSLNGGRLTSDPRAIPTYARYLVRALEEYRDAGVPLDALTLQNEPQTRWPADYPRMEMPAAQAVALSNEVGPALEAAGLSTEILGFDHNWEQHPADLAAVPDGEDPENDYALRVLEGSPWVAGTAYHCYSGDPSAQDSVRDAYPERSIWVTECSGIQSEDPARTFADTLYWHSRHLLVPALEHGASAVLTWNLVLDPAGGPHRGGCDTCTPVVALDGPDVAAREADYYVLAHAAAFIPPGSVKIGSLSDDAEFAPVAFLAPDGSVVVVLHYAGWQSPSVTLQLGETAWEVPVAPWSLTTVRIVPESPTDPGPTPTDSPSPSPSPTETTSPDGGGGPRHWKDSETGLPPGKAKKNTR